MIIDTMEHLDRYASLGENFKTAIAYLRQNDLKSLPVGKHAVDGENVFILSQENHLTEKDMSWEAHAKYADIQLILDGAEKFGWGYEGRLDPLDEARDFQTCSDVKSIDYLLTSGMFTIFFPGEMHSPGNTPAGDCVVRKLVIKVLCA
ncbi:MAG: YhcH/YjgK/YiaL family protein [Clostridia bacterium]|nr:YhcH/YjgK/YiaL family protein [Clostridia bacterium]MBR0215755.1 YhcH/YjgK/YiaL family protein [Clostridia bacterium]